MKKQWSGAVSATSSCYALEDEFGICSALLATMNRQAEVERVIRVREIFVVHSPALGAMVFGRVSPSCFDLVNPLQSEIGRYQPICTPMAEREFRHLELPRRQQVTSAEQEFADFDFDMLAKAMGPVEEASQAQLAGVLASSAWDELEA